MFPSIIRPYVIAAAALALMGAPLTAQVTQSFVPNRVTQPVDDASRVTLHGYVHPLANAANDRGAAPDSMTLDRLHLVFRRSASQEAALQQLIADEHTPGSASYHKWLTADQFGQQFGPSDQDIATVESWLSSHGFSVTGVKPGKQVLEFSGNVAQLRDAFGAQIHKYQVNGNTHFATATEPQIPSALEPVVAGFVSLNNFPVHKDARILGQASYDPKTHQAVPEWTYPGGAGGPSLNGVTFVVSPADFATQYDLNPLYTSGINGTGQSIAIINDANINLNLVQNFRSLFLPNYSATNLPNVVIDGNDPGIDGINNPDGPNYDSDEAYLDVEWSGAVAPDATIDFVIAADTALESGLILAAEHAVYSDLAPVMSLSFGACESQMGSENQFIEELWEQAAAQGQTVVVSAGDSGSAGCDYSSEYAVNGAAVSGFASTPYNVAVGGTDFYYSNYQNLTLQDLQGDWSSATTGGTATPPATGSLLTVLPEQPWNNSQFGLDALNYYAYTNDTATTIGAGGGGASSAALCVSGTNNEDWSSSGTCTAPGVLAGYAKPAWQTGVTGTQNDKVRDIPDISLFAASGANYSFLPFCYADGDCQSPSGSNPVQISGGGGTSFAAPAFAGIMALVNQKTGHSQGQADFVLYHLASQFSSAFHSITNGSNTVPCNTTTVTGDGSTYAPSSTCIAAPSGLGYKVTDPTYGTATEGQIGSGTTPYYNASAGYNLATGLGSFDANQLVNDWGSVTLQSTGVTLNTSSTSFTHGTSVTISGSVTGSSTPTGSVALMTNSSTPLQQGQGVLPLSNGSFSGSIDYLPGGTYDIWGQYSGDGTNAASTSSKTQITVTPEASTTYFNILNNGTTSSGSTAISSGGSVPYGTQLVLASQIYSTTLYNQCIAATNPPASCSTTAYTVPTGTVAYADNSTTINTAVLNAEGDAEFNAPFSVGTHSVTATYSGDASYNKSSASAITFTVAQATPTIAVTASNQNANTTTSVALSGGQSTVLNVLVENNSNSSIETSYNIGATVPVAPPTGTVTVTISGVSGSPFTATLSSAVDISDYFVDGVASIPLPSSTAAGTYSAVVSYSGDSNYAKTSTTVPITIAAAGSGHASTITASMNGSISTTSNITVTGTVTGQNGVAAPTGGVIVFSSGNELGTVTLGAGTGDTAPFSFTLDSQALAQGANYITLQYTGDKNYNPSSFNLTSSSPIANPLSDFSIIAASPTVAVTSGSGTTSLYVSPVNGFSGSVGLTCSAPSPLTCSLSSSSVSLTYSNTAGLDPRGRRGTLLATGGGAVLACVLLLTIPARWRAWRNLLSLVLFACIAGFGIGCGSSGGSGTGANVGPVGGSGSGGSGSGSGGSSSPGTATNNSTALTLTINSNGAASGSYQVTVTGTSSTTNQIHTVGVTAID